jgi:hypothetical protein
MCGSGYEKKSILVQNNGFHFDGGLLAQLKQFKNGPSLVVVSEVGVREVLKHLRP